MPSPGRQRGGKVERQREASRDRSKAREQGKALDKAAAEKKGEKQTSTRRVGMRSGKGRASPGPGLGYKGRDKGFFASSVGFEDREDVRAKPSVSAGPKHKEFKPSDAPVKTATKSQKQRMQKTVEKQRRKGLAKKESQKRQIKSDSSKTPGETKAKRTGMDARTRVGGAPGSALARALAGGRLSR